MTESLILTHFERRTPIARVRAHTRNKTQTNSRISHTKSQTRKVQRLAQKHTSSHIPAQYTAHTHIPFAFALEFVRLAQGYNGLMHKGMGTRERSHTREQSVVRVGELLALLFLRVGK